MASDIRSKIGVDGEASYRQAIKAIVQDQNKLKKEMTETAKAFSTNASAQDKARAKYAQLDRQLELSKGKLKEQKDALKALEDSGNGASREAVNLRNSIKITEAEIAALNKELKNNSPLAALGRDMQDAGKRMQEAGRKISSVGSTMTKGVTVPLVAAGAAAVKLAVDFESAIAKLDTIADSSEKTISDLRSEIMELSNATGISASELAEQSYQAISAGRSTAEAVTFVGKATRLARSGFAETGSALDVLTTIMNAYGKSGAEVTKISDQLIMTQNLGKTTVGQLAENMGQVIPTASAFGVSLENLNAAYVTLTKQGINTAGSTTRINGLLNQLGKSGTTAANALKDKTGKSFKELMESGMSLSEILAIVQEAAEKDGLALSDMFGNIRAAQAALAIMNDEGVTFTESLEAMANAAGATDTAFAKLEQTTAFKVEKAMNSVKNSGIAAGQALIQAFAPVLERVTKAIEKGARNFQNLSSAQQMAMLKTAGFAAALGPTVTVLGKLTTGTGKAIDGIGKLLEVTGKGEFTFDAISKAALGGSAAILALTAAWAAYLKKQSEANDESLKSKLALEAEVNASRNLVSAINDESAARKDSLDQIEKKGDRAKELASRLQDLNKKTKRSADEEREFRSAIAELNGIYPDLNLLIDKNSGNLAENSAAALKNVDALNKQARAAAAQQQAVDVAQRLLDVQIQLQKAQQNEAAAAKQAAGAYDDLNASAREYGGNMSVAKAKAHELTKAHKSASAEVENLKNKETELKKEQEILNGYIGEQVEGLDDVASATESAAGSAELLIESEEATSDAVEEATRKIVDGMRLQVGAFEEVEAASETSVDKMMSALQTQVNAYRDYSTNLTKALQYAKDSGSVEMQDLVSKIAEMGMSGAAELQAFVKEVDAGNDDVLKEFASLNRELLNEEIRFEEVASSYATGAAYAMKEASKAVNKASPKVKTDMVKAAKGSGEAYSRAMTAAGMVMYNATKTGMDKAKSAIAANRASAAVAARTAGTSVGSSYNEGVRSQASGATAAGNALNSNAAKALANGSSAKSSGSSQAQAYVNAIRAKYAEAKKAGEYMSQGFGDGIKAKAAYVNAKAANVASVAIKTMKNIAQERSPSKVTKEIGAYLSEGLAIGMMDELPMVRSASVQLAKAAIPSIGNPYASMASNSLDPDEMYSAVRSGAAESTRQIFLNTRELTRGLKSMGVVFNE